MGGDTPALPSLLLISHLGPRSSPPCDACPFLLLLLQPDRARGFKFPLCAAPQLPNRPHRQQRPPDWDTPGLGVGAATEEGMEQGQGVQKSELFWAAALACAPLGKSRPWGGRRGGRGGEEVQAGPASLQHRADGCPEREGKTERRDSELHLLCRRHVPIPAWSPKG